MICTVKLHLNLKPSEAINLDHLATTTFKRVGAPNLADRAKKRKIESQESKRYKML
jgi:hypothetical protein